LAASSFLSLRLVMQAQATFRSRRSLAQRLAIVGALLGALAALLSSSLKLCPVAATVHQPCPGCGLTRATLAIAHFDFGRAWEMHPFAFLLSPLLVAAAAFATVSYVRDGDARLPAWFAARFQWLGALLLLAMVPFWLARFWGFHGGPVFVP
jgi:hypothetical protein